MMAEDQEQQGILRLDLPASLQYLHVLSACLTALLEHVEKLKDDKKLVYMLQLAVHEICANCIQHAYATPSEKDRLLITLQLCSFSNALRVTVRDTGKSFDWSTVKEPALAQEQVHGYGLFLVKSVMDEVSYSRQLEGNYWYLSKKF